MEVLVPSFILDYLLKIVCRLELLKWLQKNQEFVKRLPKQLLLPV